MRPKERDWPGSSWSEACIASALTAPKINQLGQACYMARRFWQPRPTVSAMTGAFMGPRWLIGIATPAYLDYARRYQSREHRERLPETPCSASYSKEEEGHDFVVFAVWEMFRPLVACERSAILVICALLIAEAEKGMKCQWEAPSAPNSKTKMVIKRLNKLCF